MAPYYDRVGYAESRNNPDAVSPKGAKGRMQIMPNTGRDPGFGIKPWDGSDADNVRIGREYLDKMHERYRNPTDALMAYNWGPGSVDSWIKNGRNPNAVPKETRNYVKQITGQPISGQQNTGNSDMGTQPILIEQQPQREIVPVKPQMNPNAPSAAQPILRDGDLTGVLGQVTGAVENSAPMNESQMLTNMVDANVKARQAGLIGAEAAQFAQENKLAFNDPRVLAMAADNNVKPLQKGLSFLQGAIGLPFGLLRNAALGENNDLTAAFTPEKTYRSRAQAAIAALDTAGLQAKKEIAEMRQDTRQSLITAIQPVVSARANMFENSQLDVGTNPANKAIVDYAAANGYLRQDGTVDMSSPAMQQAAAQITENFAIAENRGKPDPNAGIAAALTGLTGAFMKNQQGTLGDIDAKWQGETLASADAAAKQIGTAESLLSASRRLGNVNYGGLTGSVKREVQSSLAALGYNSEDLSNAAIVEGLITNQALPRMQMLGGNDSEKELSRIVDSLGGSTATFEAREMAQLSNIASLKAQKQYGDEFRSYVRRVGRNSANQLDFMDSPEYKAFTQKKLFQFEPRILPSLARLAPDRYKNFALVQGSVYVKVGGKAVPMSSLSQEQINRAMGN